MAREVKYYDAKDLIIVGLDEEDNTSPLFDERAELPLEETMVRNIMVYGVQQPVLIRMDGDKPFVVDGRQRVKCAREANKRQEAAGEYLTRVPCLVVTAEDNRVAGIMISTNELRQDDDVLAKAIKAGRLLDILGSREEVATAFGRKVQTIDNWLLLLTADPEVHDAIRDGKIAAAVGIELAKKPREEQRKALAELLSDSPATHDPKNKKGSGGSGSGGGVKEHHGVKKGWLRKAVKTKAFEDLAEDQQEVVKWMLSGFAPKGHWVDEFQWNVDMEIGPTE